MPTPPTEPDRIDLARRMIEHIDLQAGAEHPCGYLANRSVRDVAFAVSQLPPGLYHSLMDLNFRRSGLIVYRPACERCDQCRAIRVSTDRFRPDRSQRRCWTANHDLQVGIAPPIPTSEKHDLYRRYLGVRHNRSMDDSPEAFRDFLYRSPVDSLEVIYRRDGRLVAVGILDFDGQAASTVYCYFDPADRGSLGAYNILWTIDYCRRLNIPWVYLGYHVADCAKMNYKTRFRPNEVLSPNGHWVT